MDPTTICPLCGGALEVEASRLASEATAFDQCHAHCERCGIGITNETDVAARSFLRRHWADGLWDAESERVLVFMRKGQSLRMSRTKLAHFAEERCEDRLLWDVCFALHRAGKLDAAASLMAGAAVKAPVRLRVWGHGLDEPTALEEMRSYLIDDVGELETHLPEFDAMLVSRSDVIFIEADFGSGHAYELDSPRWDRYAEMRTASGEPVWATAPGDDANRELYPLARAWACGARWTSLRAGAPRFHLVHLVTPGEHEAIDQDFTGLVNPAVGSYRRMTWDAFVRGAMPELGTRLGKVTEHLRPAFPAVEDASD